jgi:lipoate---protein ligase
MNLSDEHHIYISNIFDPYTNLAIENWLFKKHSLDKPILFLWRNNPCLVIGRAQNPWTECNIPATEKDNIPIVRRQSGGGAVYHDLGNLNYTFICPKHTYNKTNNLRVIVSALQALGIKSSITKRNDIIVPYQGNNYKVSGCAFRESKDRAFHHGTLLINANTIKLKNYLHHSQDQTIAAKGVNSVRSSVINLSTINKCSSIKSYEDELIKAFTSEFSFIDPKIKFITTNDTQKSEIQQEATLLKSWEWKFGKTLPFTQTININELTINLSVKKGIIENYDIISTKQKNNNILNTIFKEKPNYSLENVNKIKENI